MHPLQEDLRQLGALLPCLRGWNLRQLMITVRSFSVATLTWPTQSRGRGYQWQSEYHAASMLRAIALLRPANSTTFLDPGSIRES